MNVKLRKRFLAGASAAAVVAASVLTAAQAIPAAFQGDWVPLSAPCTSTVRFRVTEKTFTLINGKDSQSWGRIALPGAYFGPDYRGISVVAIPDFDFSEPFKVYFNTGEKKGVTRVEIYVEMKEPPSAPVAKLQADAQQLAKRFPLNNLPLKKC